MTCLILAVLYKSFSTKAGIWSSDLPRLPVRFFSGGSLTLIKKRKVPFQTLLHLGTGRTMPALTDMPNSYGWYNAGGVLMNLLTAICTCSLGCYPEIPLPLHLFLLFFICGFFLALMNGIPLKMSGITNDAYNLILIPGPEYRKYRWWQIALKFRKA